MILISEALKIIEREILPLKTELIDLENSVSRVLAETVKADMDLPPFDRSQMDGFAVKSNDTRNVPAKLKIIGESVAGKAFGGKLKSGEAVRIMTGAPVPKGADAVQKVEETREKDGFIEILEATKVRQNINLFASEITKGEQIFDKGDFISAQMIAAIASFGYAKIKAFRRPKVAILSTGSEIVDISETPQKDQIRNSNSLMLKVFADKLCDAEILPLVKDDVESIAKSDRKRVEKLRCFNHDRRRFGRRL